MLVYSFIVLSNELAADIFRLLSKYAPETAAEKKARLVEKAKAEAEGKPFEEKRAAFCVRYGLDNVTKLVEKKKAKLVLIANDVDPLELVMWLPALCHKMGVAYAIVAGKAKLGALVHQKTATCVCLLILKMKLLLLLVKILVILTLRLKRSGVVVSWV